MGAMWLTCLAMVDSGGKLEAATSSVDAVVSLMQAPGRHSAAFLTEVARVLKPGGDLLAQEPLLSDGQELKVWSQSNTRICQ
jgi:SAM-dependent methyltransferase